MKLKLRLKDGLEMNTETAIEKVLALSFPLQKLARLHKMTFLTLILKENVI